MTLAIIEDQAMIRDLLRMVCEREFGHSVLVSESSGQAGVEAIIRAPVEAVLLDLQLPDIDGFRVAARIRAAGCTPRFLAVSAHCDPYTVHRIGAEEFNGFVDKSCALAKEISASLSAMDQRRSYYSSSFLELQKRQRSDPLAFYKILTDKQQHILGMIGASLTDHEIANELGLSSAAAEKHRFRIMRRLEITTRSELQRYARKGGFPFSAGLS